MVSKGFIKRIEKWAEIRDRLRSHYESVDLRGAVLVDGHHVFLNIIRSIDSFRQSPEQFLRRFYTEDKDLKDIQDLMNKSKIIGYDVRRVAAIYGECIYRICDYANEKFKTDVLSDHREFLSDSSLSYPRGLSEEEVINLDLNEYINSFVSEYPPSDFLVIKAQEQRWIFDATMPPKAAVRESLERSFQYWRNRHKGRSENLETFITVLKDGNWGFFENQIRGSLVVPYDLKNQVLEALSDEDWYLGQFNLETQERHITGFNGYVESREKGVDTKLVIKGCEIAADKDVDWVWIVTADGDHAPLIEHLRGNGKEVFLTSMSYPSKALISALAGQAHYLHFDDLMDMKELLQDLENRSGDGGLTKLNSGGGMDFRIIGSAFQDALIDAAEMSGVQIPDDFK